VILAGVVSFSLAQQMPAAAAAAQSWPRPSTTQKEAYNMRLEILNQEREGIQSKLSAAVGALPKAADMQESVKGISRLQADLQAIDREIANAESQRPGAAAASRKPAVRAAGDVSPVAEIVEAKADLEYEPWDVFKNFGKKVNK
jgi:hypothetical protein